MANRKVTIWIGTRIDGQFRYLKPVTSKNNKLKPNCAIYKGNEIEIPGAIYYTHHYRGKKHVYEKISDHPQAAVYAAERLRAVLQCKAMALNSRRMRKLLKAGCAVSTKNKRPGTLELFKYDLNEFRDFWGRVGNINTLRLNEVSRDDVLNYVDWLQRRQKDPMSTTTARNKCFRLLRFLKHEKVMDSWEEIALVGRMPHR